MERKLHINDRQQTIQGCHIDDPLAYNNIKMVLLHGGYGHWTPSRKDIEAWADSYKSSNPLIGQLMGGFLSHLNDKRH